MNTVQDYPNTLLLSLLLWVICSIVICLVAGYLASRFKRRRRIDPTAPQGPTAGA